MNRRMHEEAAEALAAYNTTKGKHFVIHDGGYEEIVGVVLNAALPHVFQDIADHVGELDPKLRVRMTELSDAIVYRGEPVCSGHGQPRCAWCAGSSDRCQCSTFELTGMHWDTCPGRLRGERGVWVHPAEVLRRRADELEAEWEQARRDAA